MRENSCDPLTLQQFVDGQLHEKDCAKFLEHASTCTDCSEELDRLLKLYCEIAKESLRLHPVPKSVNQRVFHSTALVARRLWWALPVAASFALAFLLISRPINRVVASVSGEVLIDGIVAKPGTVVRSGSRITTIGDSLFVIDGRHFRSSSDWNEFSFEFKGSAWETVDQVGPLEIDHQGKVDGFGVRLQNWKFAPLGTRFSIEPGFNKRPQLDVFESAVEARSGSSTQTISEGSSLGSLGIQAIEDDPFVAIGKQLPNISLFENIGNDSQQFSANQLPPEATTRIRQASKMAASDARRYLSIALELSKVEERQDAGFLIAKYLELDPLALIASFEELAQLLYSQSAFDGNQDIAFKIMELLHKRNPDFSSADWMTVLNGEKLSERVGAAKRLVSNIPLSGQLSVLAMVVKSANDSAEVSASNAQKLDARQFAIQELKRVLHDSSGIFNTRTLARILGVLAEAQYFIPGQEQESLLTLSRSVSLWPRLQSRIHFVARRSEAETVLVDDRKMIAASFAESPTFYAAERVLTFLRDTGSGQEGFRSIEEFAKWIGEIYRTVPEAQALASEHIYLSDPMRAYRFMRREIELWKGNPEPIPQHHQVFYAKLLWKLRGHVPEASESANTEDIAVLCDLMNGDKFAPLAYDYFAFAGDYKNALLALEDSDVSSQEVLFTKAIFLREQGHLNEAGQLFRKYLDRQDRVSDNLHLHNAQVSIAEIVAISNPEAGRKLAKLYLTTKQPPLDHGWLRFRRYDLKFKARAYWVLGEKARAIQLLRQFLTEIGWHPDREKDDLLLATWRHEFKSGG